MRVLLLSYYFPPSGGPGVQRGVKLCRELLALGDDVAVVTVRPDTYAGAGEYARDPTLAEDVPSGLRVIRTPPGGPPLLLRVLEWARLGRLAQHAFPALAFERQAGWFAPALAACLDEVEASAPDVLLTSSQPYVAHLVGREVRRRTGVPWAADFRDPWVLSWGLRFASRRAFDWQDAAEAAVLDEADHVVMNTPGSARELLARRTWIAPDKVSVVRNGYDPVDFAVEPAPRPDGDTLIVHTGSFRARPPGRPRTGLRAWLDGREYGPVPYDRETHSPRQLFEAVALAGTDRLRVRLVGAVPAPWLDLAHELGIAAAVEATGYVPHREATAHLRAADLLYLPTVTRHDGKAVSNVPAKTYEYLGSGRPLAVLAGPGDVRDITEPVPRATVLEARDVEGLARLIGRVRDGTGPEPVDVDPPDARPWRREAVARRMRASLERACAAARANSDKSRGDLNPLP